MNKATASAYLPLSFAPREAFQFDWSHEIVLLSGVTAIVKGAREGIGHVRGAPCHPQTQGKIERWHQTLKNRVLLENYYRPGHLEVSIDKFVDHYNHRRYHESLSNLTPADGYFGRGQ